MLDLNTLFDPDEADRRLARRRARPSPEMVPNHECLPQEQGETLGEHDSGFPHDRAQATASAAEPGTPTNRTAPLRPSTPNQPTRGIESHSAEVAIRPPAVPAAGMRVPPYAAGNAVDPRSMTAAERVEEVCALLGLAIRRHQARRRNSAELSETGLDVSGNKRLHVSDGGALDRREGCKPPWSPR